MSDAADYIDIFVNPSPGASVRRTELYHSCKALFVEEHGTRPAPPHFDDALRARGYTLVHGGRIGGRRVRWVCGAAWNDSELAAEAEFNRLTADANRAQHTNAHARTN